MLTLTQSSTTTLKFNHNPEALNDLHAPNNRASSEPAPSREEIRKGITSMKLWKTPRIDQITAEVLKAGGKQMVDMLHKNVLKVWSRMIVNLIHKKGDKLNPANYRAIVLLSIPGKVFLYVLLQRIKQGSEKWLKESQYGFRLFEEELLMRSM